MRTWLRAERARENTEDLDAGVFEPYPTETSGVYRRDWLGAPLGPRSMVGTPIVLVTKISTTWGSPPFPDTTRWVGAVEWTDADDVGSVTAYETKPRA